MTDLSIFDWLLSNKLSIYTKEIVSLYDWKDLFFKQAADWDNTTDMAIAGGFISDRLAYAFTAGYWSALYCLIPMLPAKTITALCVSEKEGNHPKAIKTNLTSPPGNDGTIWVLNGNKSFVTCANDAELLLIATSTGISSNGRNSLRLVRVDPGSPGISIKSLKDLPFIPEISHGELELNNVQVSDTQILPGDGYTNYIKPFRTLEDIHMTSAILGYLFRTACLFNWPQDVKSQILALLAGIKSISVLNPLENSLHILLGGISSLFSTFTEAINPHWNLTDDKTRSNWERDKQLLTIAKKEREKRLSSAWNHYEP